jgi:monovalent cation:H+ antiporter-2, CPA2 family
MEKEGLNLILAGALFSITLNPLTFAAADRLIRRVQSNPQLRRQFEETRGNRFSKLKQDLDSARQQAAEKAAAQRTFTPEELVDRFPLFEGLTPEQREVLLLHFEPRTAQPGERIIRAGDKAETVYFIVDGQVEVAVGGRRIKLGAGDFFGEMALISGLPRAADVTALDFSKFATLSRRDFRQFLARFPAIRDQVAALASKRRETNRHLASEHA